MKKCTRGFPYWEGCWAYVSCISSEVLLASNNCTCNITTRRSGLCIGYEIESRSQKFQTYQAATQNWRYGKHVNAVENRARASKQQL